VVARWSLRPRRAVRIRRDGSFSFSGRRRALILAVGERRVFKFAVHGRFTTRDRARIVYSVKPGATAFGCGSRAQVLKLHRNGRAAVRRLFCPTGQDCSVQLRGACLRAAAVFYWGFVPFAYACLYTADQRVVLGPNGFDERGVGMRLAQFRLAGPYLAYGCGGNWLSKRIAGVRVVDLRDGSIRSPEIMPAWASYVTGFSVPRDVELKDNGSVA
jgi:hypothetical protein